MFRAEQLERSSKGLRLMPDDVSTPVMPEYTPGTAISPEMQKQIDNYRTKQDAARSSVGQ